jgi:hypothetical protein
MPLDTTTLPRPRGLQEIANYLGIIGIDPQLLSAHKAAELAQAPKPNANPTFIENCLVGGYVAALVGFLGSSGIAFGLLIYAIRYLDLEMLIGGIAFGLAGGLFINLLKRLLRAVDTVIFGPAQWNEVALPGSHLDVVCPTELAALARRVLDETRHSDCLTLVYGELRQDMKLLDPYLLVRDESNGEELILGVWKDNDILYLAG